MLRTQRGRRESASLRKTKPSPGRLLERALAEWNHEAVSTCHGLEALQALQGEQAPKLAILDWGLARHGRAARSAGEFDKSQLPSRPISSC